METPYAKTREILTELRYKIGLEGILFRDGEAFHGVKTEECCIAGNALIATACAMLGKTERAKAMLAKLSRRIKSDRRHYYDGINVTDLCAGDMGCMAIGYASIGKQKKAKQLLEECLAIQAEQKSIGVIGESCFVGFREDYYNGLEINLTCESALTAIAYAATGNCEKAKEIFEETETQANRKGRLYHRAWCSGDYGENPYNRYVASDNASMAILHIILGHSEEVKRIISGLEEVIGKRGALYHKEKHANNIETFPNAFMAIGYGMLDGASLGLFRIPKSKNE